MDEKCIRCDKPAAWILAAENKETGYRCQRHLLDDLKEAVRPFLSPVTPTSEQPADPEHKAAMGFLGFGRDSGNRRRIGNHELTESEEILASIVWLFSRMGEAFENGDIETAQAIKQDALALGAVLRERWGVSDTASEQ